MAAPSLPSLDPRPHHLVFGSSSAARSPRSDSCWLRFRDTRGCRPELLIVAVPAKLGNRQQALPNYLHEASRFGPAHLATWRPALVSARTTMVEMDAAAGLLSSS
uniref:Uncharacterized protein n=1 Tax=Triticum urartu TaxID=4572 RepID=A0A8R7UYX4_TRIUA